jgi:hypothetical protein
MGQSLNKLVYDIKNIYYGGFQSDDNQVSDRQVAYWINQDRATLLAQLLSVGKAIPDTLIQHLECVQLECLDPAECCEIDTCERVLRSTQRIPDTIHRNNRNTILSVSSPDKTVGFTETNYIRQRSNKHSKYTGHKPRWFIKNGYLYLTNTKELEYVSLSGIFDDPTEALLFTQCDGTPCWTWDDEYPITNRLAGIITTKVLQEKLGLVQKALNDENNDARGQGTQQGSGEQD